MSKKRNRNLVDARCIITDLLLRNGFYLTEVGEFLERDHSTIINSKSIHKNNMAYNDAYKKMYNECVASLSIYQNSNNGNEVGALIDEIEQKLNLLRKKIKST